MAETPKVRKKKFTYFIGIDVSRNELDYAVMQGKNLLFHEERKNVPEDIVAFVLKLKTLPGFTMAKAVFCMEQTGYYCNHLLNALKKLKANITVENPVRIKNSLGLLRGKDDKSDSIRIAGYAQKNKDDLKLWVPRRPIMANLSGLFALRNRLLGISVALNTPLNEEVGFVQKGAQKQNRQSCRKSIDAIQADLQGVDKTIDCLIASDDHLKRLFQLITSVNSVGRITAIQIIISTNEFKDIRNPKKFACYAGVAPFKRVSGLMIGTARVSHVANKKVKFLLHLCALNAVKHDEELKTYYERKTKTEGKAKLLVLNAVRYKLISRIFACLNEDRLYVRDYIRANELTASE